jgi:cholesterol oxidase
MLSLMWGSGWPALYEHENLDEITHRRGGDLYGPTSLNYHKHVVKMLKGSGHAVRMEPEDPQFSDMPDDYAEAGKDIKSPILFMTGRNNRVFADSNIVCHEFLNAARPGRHELHIFEGYGHQDPFMGKNNHLDIFPRLVEWLKQNRGAA